MSASVAEEEDGAKSMALTKKQIETSVAVVREEDETMSPSMAEKED
jgi:hypothetical protein